MQRRKAAISLDRLPLILMPAAMLALAACSPNSAPNPNLKKTLMPCLTISNVQAGKILGAELTAFKLTGDNAPIGVCDYNDSQNNTQALLQIQKLDAAKNPDPVALLTADANMTKSLFKNSVVPLVVHDATGFGPGAFFVDNTQGPTASSVQLHFVQDGYKITVQVNNPKDFPSGEKQVTDLAQQALSNLKDGSAFQAV